MAESFAGLQPLDGGATASRTSVMGDEAASLLDLVSRTQFPSRLAGWKTALQALTERAEGAPAALEGLVSPKLQEMAQQIMQSNARLSRTFGPYGGNQLPAAMGQQRASLDLPGLYANTAIDAGQQLQNFLGNTSIIAPTGQNTTEVRQRPIDLASIAKQWAGLMRAGASLYSGAAGMGGGSGGQNYDTSSNTQMSSTPMMSTPSWGSSSGGGMTFGNTGGYPYMYEY